MTQTNQQIPLLNDSRLLAVFSLRKVKGIGKIK
jgi:hypothetical protein